MKEGDIRWVLIDKAYMWITVPSNKRSFLIPFSIA